jgi:hypothetical protein
MILKGFMERTNKPFVLIFAGRNSWLLILEMAGKL